MTGDVVVIGTGLAGYQFAKEFRKLNQTTHLAMVTTDDGAFYSKPLLSRALLDHKTPEQLALFSAEEMADKLHADIHTSTSVVDIDTAKKTVRLEKAGEFQTLLYDNLVLAVGAKPIPLDIDGDAVDQILTVNSLRDYRCFREHLDGKKNVAIIGAGLVGCEFANDLLQAGLDVTVIAPESEPLSRFLPPALGREFRDAMETHGLQWELENVVNCVSKAGSGYELTMSGGVVKRVDLVMSAIGIRPELTLAKQSGLHVNRGISVNDQLQTSDASIYALGDCAEVNGVLYQFVAPILHSATVLAKVIAKQQTTLKFPCMPIVIKTPYCPAVSAFGSGELYSECLIEGSGKDLSAYSCDASGKMLGFALLGEKVREKADWQKRVGFEV